MKKLLSLMTAMLIFISTSMFVFASDYDNQWNFEDKSVGDYIVGDWNVLRNRYYKVEEAFDNKFLETTAGQHTDYFENMQTLSEELGDFSAQFRVKFIEFKDSEWGTLAFYFRAQNNANSYILWLKQNVIEIVDMDMTDPEYSDLQYNRIVTGSHSQTFDYRKWYQINIISTTVDPFVEGEEGTFGKIKNEIYLNGTKIIDWTDDYTWFQHSGFMLYAWDTESQIDDIKISYDTNKYKPSGPVTPVQDEIEATPTPKPTKAPTTGATPTKSPTAAPTESGSDSLESSSEISSQDSSEPETSQDSNISESSEDLSSESEDSSTTEESTASDTDSKIESEESQSESEQNSNTKVILIIIAIVAIAGAGAAMYFFVLKPKA